MSNPETVLYTGEQVYQIEGQWFELGNDSFGLMQQAAWQMACWVAQHITNKTCTIEKTSTKINKSALVWVGSGNNGGDGWLVAHYLRQFGWQITVVEVAEANTNDGKRAKKIATDNGCVSTHFTSDFFQKAANSNQETLYIDALFGIGLDREPTGVYAQAINYFNHVIESSHTQSISIDIPSGLIASTGKVFNQVAIRADFTLCLIAQKLGLFTKDGKDYSGKVVTLPLIPLPKNIPSKATRLTKPVSDTLSKRQANCHKGSFGHALIIGGNKTPNGHGMGGASILASQGAFAVGVGKLSVACHTTYHGALLATMPNAMTLDLHNVDSVSTMIEQVDMVAIGMGLGRDRTKHSLNTDSSEALFEVYVAHAISHKKDLLIDADGLYHLAYCSDEFIQTLKDHAQKHFVAYTPHTGEMAKLLNISNESVEDDRLSAIQQANETFSGNWLLKGAGSLVIENSECYLCDAGNAGMATAGMGDVLSGVVAGLQAQTVNSKSKNHSLTNGVLIHAMAGDKIAEEVGEYGLQAQDMQKKIALIVSSIS